MASKSNTFEGGSDTTTITTGNSGGGSGDAWDTVSLDTNGSITFSATHAAHGSLSGLVSTAGTAAGPLVSWTSGVSATTVYWRAYLWIDAAPSANENLLRVRDSANGITSTVRINSTGKIAFLYGASTLGATSSNNAPTGQWFRVESKIVNSTTAGSVDVRLYLGADPDSTTITETLSVSSVNTGSNNAINRYQLGFIANISNFAVYFDDIAWSDVDWIGPVQGATPITLTDSGAGSETATVTAAVPLSESGSGSDATSVSAAVPLTESGQASDAISVDMGSTPKPVSDSGVGSETLTATATVPLAEAGSAADTASIAATASLSDSGAASDSIAVSVPKSLSDSGSGSETVTAAVSAALADAAAATEQIALAALVAAAETGRCTDAIAVQISTPGERPGVLRSRTGPPAGLTTTTSSVGDLTTGVGT